MTALISLHNAIFDRIDRQDWVLPTLARFLFAAVLLFYYWNSGLTKLGDRCVVVSLTAITKTSPVSRFCGVGIDQLHLGKMSDGLFVLANVERH